jgi:hypothetical protein
VVEALAHDLEIRQPLGLAVDEADRDILRLSDHQFGVLRTLALKAVRAADGGRRIADAFFLDIEIDPAEPGLVERVLTTPLVFCKHGSRPRTSPMNRRSR